MSLRSVLGILLLAAGAVILTGTGLAYQSVGETANIAGLEVTVVRRNVMPPIIGGLATFAGLGLLMGRRRKGR